ncbi:hypothetical protein [Armatimonas rosea]|uniref:Uncharacterized protein n=1 Tax=Armatimonas rosea TaxID=685828 RepID=A0A7W9SP40_ARMRO|nr:hypothetical protein [Armatimonas rosea]MBB6050141.1 hypothetical protein [Armatimonas rosea]
MFLTPPDEKALRATAFAALIAYALQRDSGMCEYRPSFALFQVPSKPQLVRVPKLSLPDDAQQQFEAHNGASLKTVALSRSEQARLTEAFRVEQRRQKFLPAKKTIGKVTLELGPSWWDGKQAVLVSFRYQYSFDDHSLGDGGSGSAVFGGIVLQGEARRWKLSQVVPVLAAG